MRADNPFTLLAQGKIANVPLIIGANKDEGTLFNSRVPVTLPDSFYEQVLVDTYGATLGPLVEAAYPLTQYQSPYWASSHALGDGLVRADHTVSPRLLWHEIVLTPLGCLWCCDVWCALCRSTASRCPCLKRS